MFSYVRKQWNSPAPEAALAQVDLLALDEDIEDINNSSQPDSPTPSKQPVINDPSSTTVASPKMDPINEQEATPKASQPMSIKSPSVTDTTSTIGSPSSSKPRTTTAKRRGMYTAHFFLTVLFNGWIMYKWRFISISIACVSFSSPENVQCNVFIGK